jgi:hypothetical protein
MRGTRREQEGNEKITKGSTYVPPTLYTRRKQLSLEVNRRVSVGVLYRQFRFQAYDHDYDCLLKIQVGVPPAVDRYIRVQYSREDDQ